MHANRQQRPGPALTRPSDPGLRVGDAERGRVVDQLADHHAAGRLTLPEFEERMAAAWTARTGADLELLLRDLPTPARPARRRPSTGPRPRLDGQLASYLAVVAVLWVVWLVAGAGHPWPVWVMFGWGVKVFGHRAGHLARSR